MLNRTSLLSLYAPASDAPVYMEQKSNKPSNTGLQTQTEHLLYVQFLRAKAATAFSAS